MNKMYELISPLKGQNFKIFKNFMEIYAPEKIIFPKTIEKLRQILLLALSNEFTDRKNCIIRQISKAINENNYHLVAQKLAQLSREFNLGSKISDYYIKSETLDVQNSYEYGNNEDLDEALDPVIPGRFIWCREYIILKIQIKDDEIYRDICGRVTCQSQVLEEKRVSRRQKYYKNAKAKAKICFKAKPKQLSLCLFV